VSIVTPISQNTTRASSLFQARDADFIVQRGYEIVADQFSAFALPRDSPEELVRYHLAAHKAYYLRYNSIDHVLRTYSDCWNDPPAYPEPYELIHEGTSKIRASVDAIVEKRHGLSNLPDHFGLVAAGAALIRAQTSFRAACVLCETGMGFEVFCLAKLVLEQIAWAYAVHKIEDRSLYKVKPPNCINQLKGLFPSAGRLYGLMNEQAHMDPKTIHDFVKLQGDDCLIILRSMDKCLLGCLYLLQLADMYGTYMEVVYRPWYTAFEFINTRRRGPKPKSRRNSLNVLKVYRTKVLQYLDQVQRASEQDRHPS
jgi:hypothetical protein